jgi:hypothetical protein
MPKVIEEAETVWVLSSGEYSDYRVHCVVRGGEAEAEMLAARANADGSHYDSYCAEELPIVSSDVSKVEVLTLVTVVSNDGIAEDAGPRVRVEWPFDALYGTPTLRWRWVRAPMYNDKAGRLEVWGIDHERVRKVFSDRRAALMSDDALRARNETEGAR